MEIGIRGIGLMNDMRVFFSLLKPRFVFQMRIWGLRVMK